MFQYIMNVQTTTTFREYLRLSITMTTIHDQTITHACENIKLVTHIINYIQRCFIVKLQKTIELFSLVG